MGFADEMRSPSSGCMGWMARNIMKGEMKFHAAAVDALLDVQPGSTVLELGSGSGGALRQILTKSPAKVYSVEISDVYRKELAANAECAAAISAGKLSIHGDDAKALSFIPSGSVDRILGINVVYFLDPLDEYHKEFARVLKPGGMLVWTCKEMVKTMDKSVYKNTDWPTVVESMKKAGLNGSVGAENKGVHDIPVIGKK